MAQLVRCLPNKHETLSLGFSNPRIKLAVAAWAYNPGTWWEAEIGGSHKLAWPTWWSDMPMRDPASNNGWSLRGPLELFFDLYMCAMYAHSYRPMHRYTQIHCVTLKLTYRDTHGTNTLCHIFRYSIVSHSNQHADRHTRIQMTQIHCVTHLVVIHENINIAKDCI